MPVYNSEVANILEEVADILDIQGANQFRIRAYRNAARKVRNLSRSLEDMVNKGKDLTEIEGVGKDMANKLEEIARTGKLKQLEELKGEFPEALTTLLSIEGLGPERVGDLHQELGIETTKDLEKALEEGKVQELHGFGEKITAKIKKALEEGPGEEKRTKLKVAEQYVEPLVQYLKKDPNTKDVVVAGSYRRKKETVGDIDILTTGKKGEGIIHRFTEFEDIGEIVSEGETKSTVKLRTGIQVDLRVVAEESYGAALMYFTGSKAHNIKLRNLALKERLKLNEYGVFRGEESVAGETEEEIYKLFNLPYIPPEIREDRGEVEAAKEGNLPNLVKLDDIRGDLQIHTKNSDGEEPIETMVKKCKKLGYEYIAITDHSAYMGITQGLDKEGVEEQIKQIKKINKKLDGITILSSIEVDIMEDGSLDLPNNTLKKLDIVTCSIHSKFNLPPKEQTQRILNAMDNPYFHIFGHPTGRVIGGRSGYEYDMEKVFKKAKEKNCFLEINAQPDRLDLDDAYAKMAKELGVKMTISSDAHSLEELDFLKYGINQARRGWLEPHDVLNTYPLTELQNLLQKEG
ncbi:MAG: DNA polymerase/3'-5' exonuclease PolX [Patescibacteria group bacterium]|nr:DNA polymerase/3'-5' exonuclease PolX [Patescibacteria group bacterium]